MLKFLRRLFAAADEPPPTPRRRGVIFANVMAGGLFEQSVQASERFSRELHNPRRRSMPLHKPPAPLRTLDDWLRNDGTRDPEQPQISSWRKPRYRG